MKEYKIDAKNQILGRLATKIAILLQGKNTAGYDPNSSLKRETTFRSTVQLVKLFSERSRPDLQRLSRF